MLDRIPRIVNPHIALGVQETLKTPELAEDKMEPDLLFEFASKAPSNWMGPCRETGVCSDAGLDGAWLRFQGDVRDSFPARVQE